MTESLETLKNLCCLKPTNQIAVIFHDGKTEEKLSYEDFLDLENKLCLQLKRIISLSEDYTAIGTFLEPCSLLPVIIHTLIDLSASFVPLPLNVPPITLISILRKCAVRYVIVQKHLLNQLESISEENLSICKLHYLERFNGELLLAELSMRKCIPYKRISYVVHSSGSTGTPKAIFVPHQCIIPNIVDLREIFSVSPNDVLFIPSALTFDASIVQMLLTWLAGGTMVIISKEVHSNPTNLSSILYKTNVSLLQCTPSFLHFIGNDLLMKHLFSEHSKLRLLALGGERFPSRETTKRWFPSTSNIKLFNIYGTSEVSSWAAIYEVKHADYVRVATDIHIDWVPIGAPLSNTCLEVRCDNGEVVSEGYGEIWIGGEERKSIVESEDEKLETSIGNMRFTGDMGQVKDGHVYFCGRANNKVKHNGQLIDLDLMCAVIEREFDHCYCLMESHGNPHEELILFVKETRFKDQLMNTEASIINHVRKKLSPPYIPENIVFVERIPLTSHGKIDKFFLKKECLKKSSGFNRLSLESYLRQCWNISLGFPIEHKVDNNDNFVECGGDSFAAVHCLNCILRYAGDMESGNKPLNKGALLRYILESTYNDILVYLKDKSSTHEYKSIHSKISSRKRGIHGTHSDSKVETLRNIDENCLHFNSFQKQNVNIRCRCFKETSNSHAVLNIVDTTSFKLVEHWKFNLRKCIDASPLVIINDEFKDGVVYLGAHSHIMAAVTLNGGDLIWKTLLGDRIESSATMCYGGKFIAVGCYDGYIYILSASSGEIHWKHYMCDIVKSSPALDIVNRKLIIGSHGKKIQCIDVMMKSCIWTFDCDSSCFSSPLINHTLNSVYATLLSGQVVSLDINSGKLVWVNTLPKPIFSSPCLCGDVIVVGCVDSSLYAINNKGETVWKFESGAPIFSSPVFFKDRIHEYIVFGSNDRVLYFLNKNGEVYWKFETTASIYSSVALLEYRTIQQQVILDPVENGEKHNRCMARNAGFDDKRSVGDVKILESNLDKKSICSVAVVSTSTNGELNVLDVDKRSILASYKFLGGVFSSPVVIKDKIVVGCRNDHLYCLQVVPSYQVKT